MVAATAVEVAAFEDVPAGDLQSTLAFIYGKVTWAADTVGTVSGQAQWAADQVGFLHYHLQQIGTMVGYTVPALPA